MKEIHKVGHPVFILSLTLLILNDWFFKTAFHNEITGKLSDFAGLFAFPFLISLLLPKHKKSIHILTALLFIIWNSELSQVIISYLNQLSIPVGRTIDITDNIALVSILASYHCLNHKLVLTLKPWFQKGLIMVSCLAFMATSLPPQEYRAYVNIDKEYTFEFSKRELVSRLNMVQIKEVHRVNKYSGAVDFDSKTNVFHYEGHSDTLALILDPDVLRDQDTIMLKTALGKIMLSGDQTNSQLKLLTVYKIIPASDEKDYRAKAIKEFEKRIVNEIKKYR
ncbi:MAG: hypothetical protein AB8H47_21450 [Bacteroidia bacterium]